MSIAYVHTFAPLASVPDGYFDEQNIQFIQKKVTEVLKPEFKQEILIDRAFVIRIMQRIIEEWVEAVPRMNQRVIMELCSEWRRHWIETNKHLVWERGYVSSQKLYDKIGQLVHFDPQIIKHPNRYGVEKFSGGGARTRFYFT